MSEFIVMFTPIVFLLSMIFILWRPKGVNEAIPAAAGAAVIFILGAVSLSDLAVISQRVSGAAITIMATIVMAIALESFGFYHWMASKLLEAAKQSGIKLFWLTNSLCFFMTLFLNNDGSILITTPILILLLKYLGLKKRQMFPYLISGAIIATASSAPIGVSNIVNLIALEIIGIDLYLHTALMLLPGTVGLLFLSGLLYLVLQKDIPRTIPRTEKNIAFWEQRRYHPLESSPAHEQMQPKTKQMVYILLFVFLIRISLFAASYIGISVPIVAVLGSIILLVWRWISLKASPMDVLKKTPWHIFIFAYSMYVIIYGLNNIGLTAYLVERFEPIVSQGLFHASMTMGILLSALSNMFNNHPALMIGTLTLTEMNLDPVVLKTIYLANIIGSDMGSLLLPMGTLATLIWMHILKQHKIKITWKRYMKVSFIVIPPTVVFTLICLYYWIRLVYAG
ncbi:arsenic transporter [Siminovitchia sediminis]|uniref:Arsenic transporter n=1 Tax=Siminovitchia sediminis TaxID=1274353 RepID=A0ABW4KLR6_9BACI